MTPRQRLAASVAAIWTVIGGWEPARVQTSEQLFDQSVLHEIRLFINSRDLALLREHYDENTHYPADLHWGTLRVPNVSVRSRGLGSRSRTKLGLQIDFTQYATGQRFAGLKSLVLKNLLQDPSMVREALAMAMFNRMGQPAPRESFCRLYINGVYEGLYAVVEDIDDLFLARTLGSGSGYLFEFHLGAAVPRRIPRGRPCGLQAPVRSAHSRAGLRRRALRAHCRPVSGGECGR